MRQLSLSCADFEGWRPSFLKPGDEILTVTGKPLPLQLIIIHLVDNLNQLKDSLLERHFFAFKVPHFASVKTVKLVNLALKPINEEHEVIPRCRTEVLFVRDKELIELDLEVRVEEFLRFGRQTGNPLPDENLKNCRHDLTQVPSHMCLGVGANDEHVKLLLHATLVFAFVVTDEEFNVRLD